MTEHPDAVAFGLPRITAPALTLAAAGLIGVGLTTDTAGRISGGIAAALLLLTAAWVSRGPTLVADRTGVTVRGPFRRRHLSWNDVVAIVADDRRRSRAVEFETADGLIVVPASLLGHDTASGVAEIVSGLWQEYRSAAPAPPS